MSNTYIINISSFDNYDACITSEFMKFTPPEIQSKISRYHFKEDAYRCLLGELLKRYMICTFLGVKNESISIKYNDFQKPIIDSVSNCFFNISHSGEYVAGIIDSGLTGIDIEKITAIDIDIVNKFFHPKEKDILQKISQLQELNEKFFLIWTAKEAYIKALGKGLSKTLASFYVQIDPSGGIKIIDEDPADMDCSHINSVCLKDDYVVSTAACSSPEYCFFADVELFSRIRESGYF